MAPILSVIAILVSLVALAVALFVPRKAATPAREVEPVDPADLPTDVNALRSEVAALRADLGSSLRNIGVVRYDAFADVGGHLSWSAALLDDRGAGMLITSIHSRTDARTYAKTIADWTCEQPLSTEEQSAIERTRNG